MTQALIVADVDGMRQRFTEGVLRGGASSCVQAYNPAEATARLGEGFKVLIVDLGYGEGEVRQLLQAARQQSAAIITVVAGAPEQAAALQQLLAQGADEIVIKPFTSTDLAHKVEAWLKKRG
jgi:CheY-like chemotaxis protein